MPGKCVYLSEQTNKKPAKDNGKQENSLRKLCSEHMYFKIWIISMRKCYAILLFGLIIATALLKTVHYQWKL